MTQPNTGGYEEVSQVYYYERNNLGPLIAGELRQCLQNCGSVFYPENQASATPVEIVMVLMEIKPKISKYPSLPLLPSTAHLLKPC